VQKHID